MDRLEIREIIENWVIWRDSGQWDRFATLWHADARMVATWQQSSAADFIAACRAAWEKGPNGLHHLGGSSIDVAGTRAIAQTKMTIHQRAPLHGVVVDVACMGRFYDFLEKRDGRWGIVLRQPIYERDSLHPVNPGDRVELDRDLLETFPEGYRYLAYLQRNMGLQVKTDMPGLADDIVERLYAKGRAWLAGTPDFPG
jgi:hypothetical protein